MMKRILIFVFGLMTLSLHAVAQDIDMSYVFVDEMGTLLDNGSTVVRNTVDDYGDGLEVIYSGISVKNISNSDDWIKVLYTVENIDNGKFQICFPTSCNNALETGSYETPIGQLMDNLQNIQSEWFPTDDGACVVTLTLELLMKIVDFPPIYIHKAYGPTLTIKFIKGELPPEPTNGDVNGDGEVNIADVNAVINMILSQSSDPAGDVNGDSEVNIADVNALIDLILDN